MANRWLTVQIRSRRAFTRGKVRTLPLPLSTPRFSPLCNNFCVDARARFYRARFLHSQPSVSQPSSTPRRWIYRVATCSDVFDRFYRNDSHSTKRSFRSEKSRPCWNILHHGNFFFVIFFIFNIMQIFTPSWSRNKNKSIFARCHARWEFFVPKLQYFLSFKYIRI